MDPAMRRTRHRMAMKDSITGAMDEMEGDLAYRRQLPGNGVPAGAGPDILTV